MSKLIMDALVSNQGLTSDMRIEASGGAPLSPLGDGLSPGGGILSSLLRKPILKRQASKTS